MDKPLLVFENVVCSFKDFRLELDFSINRNEFVTFFGVSGAGKTTALHLIAGIIRPDSGRIYLNGIDITDLPPWKRSIGVVFQDYSLFPNMSAGKNISYGMKNMNRQEKKEAASVWLDRVGLETFSSRNIATLSGGQKQRIAIARALASKPQLLIFDEPLSALDGLMRKNIGGEISRLHNSNDITTLYITHDVNEALSFSDRIAVFADGKIVQFDTPSNIYSNPADSVTAALTGSLCNLKREDGSDIFFRPENILEGSVDGAFTFTAELTGEHFKGSYSDLEFRVTATGELFYVPSYLANYNVSIGKSVTLSVKDVLDFDELR